MQSWGVVGAALMVTVLLAGPSGCSSATSSSLPPGTRLPLAVTLRSDRAGLERFVATISDPADPSYGRYLDVGEVAARYGAPRSAVDKALAALRKLGAVDVRADPSGTLLLATVDAAVAERVFGTGFSTVQGPNGRYAVPERTPSLPRGLRPDATGVIGLGATLGSATPERATGGSADNLDRYHCQEAQQASEIPPAAIAARYGIPGLESAGHRGGGRELALLEVAPYTPMTFEALSACRGLPVPKAPVVHQVPALPAVAPDTEVGLDVIVARAIAPEADIHVVTFDRYSSIVFGLAEALAIKGGLDAQSMSFGICETSLTSGEIDAIEGLLLAAAAAGTTVVASSGDRGSSGCPDEKRPGVQYPASSPHVLAVGGTDLRRLPDGSIAEVAWRDDVHKLASGGGTSTKFHLPAFQAAARITVGARAVPDVAYLADPRRVQALPSCDGISCHWRQTAGTSAPAPGFAAALLLVTDALGGGRQPTRLGWFDPLLYTIATENVGAFSDVTAGSNDLFGVGCCSASAGFDLVTGWGSIRGPALLAALRTKLAR